MLHVENLHVEVQGTPSSGLHLRVEAGEVHTIMGPNGPVRARSRMSYLVGMVTSHEGRVLFRGEDLLEMSIIGRQ